LAEAQGFEPWMQFKPHTPLAGEPLQPLGHASGSNYLQRNEVYHATLARWASECLVRDIFAWLL